MKKIIALLCMLFVMANTVYASELYMEKLRQDIMGRVS